MQIIEIVNVTDIPVDDAAEYCCRVLGVTRSGVIRLRFTGELHTPGRQCCLFPVAVMPAGIEIPLLTPEAAAIRWRL